MRPALLVGVLVMLSACSRPGPAPAPTAATSPTGTAQASSLTSEWQQRGVTQAPPDSLKRVSLGEVEVVNQTAGAVQDQEARTWAAAYLRDNAYELWAWAHLQDQFLVRSNLSRASVAVFGTDLSTIGKARQAGMTIQVTRLTLRRLVLRPVPQALRDLYANYGYAWTPYAFYLDEIGPSDVWFVDRDGHRTPAPGVPQVGQGVGASELVGGQLTHDALMGDLWTQDSDWDCSASFSRARFGTLCSP
jgi:hypothetical protein